MVQPDVEASFESMFDELAEMPDLDASWLEVASRLLRFCAIHAPPAESWAELEPGEPFDTVAAVQASGLAVMVGAEQGLAAALHPPDDDGAPDHGPPLSFMSRPVREALRDAAKRESAATGLADRRLHLVAVARGLAGSIDELAGNTYVQWFRARGEVTLSAGQPYPVCRHDPRPWLGSHAANTDPRNLPHRDLAHTRRLRIAGAAPYTYVIDFDIWNRLSPIGAAGHLTVGVAQPNQHLGEFDIRFVEGSPRTFANHGPRDVVGQAQRIQRLAARAFHRGADVVVMPEYTLTEEVHGELVTRDTDEPRPLVVCTGIGGGPDDAGYMTNEGRLIITTPGIERDYSVGTPAKLHPAHVGDAVERVRSGTEIRVFASERWTLCVLICRDGMDDSIVTQLAAIGVNLLLVPAMSPRTTSLIDSACAACHLSQAFVVIANGPAVWAVAPVESPLGQAAVSRAEAVFAGPYAELPNRFWAVSSPADEGTGDPSLWTLSFADPTIQDNDSQ